MGATARLLYLGNKGPCENYASREKQQVQLRLPPRILNVTLWTGARSAEEAEVVVPVSIYGGSGL